MNELYDLLHRCTVRIAACNGRSHGTGFFVAPRTVMTCAHVITGKMALPCPDPITIFWDGRDFAAKITASLSPPYPDLALLDVEVRNHPCVVFGDPSAPFDQLYGCGYATVRERMPWQSITARCEGWRADDERETSERLLLFKEAQIVGGLSGAPLLNLRTRGICGVIKMTRDAESDLGGLAVPADVVARFFPEVIARQKHFHETDSRWSAAAAKRGRTDSPIGGTPGDGASNNLPPRPPIVGREREIAEIEGQLLSGEVRLLTLTGPGGVGKTRLAIQVATDLLPHLGDGAYLVDLVPISNPSAIAAAISVAIGVLIPDHQRPVDALLDYVRDRHLLLVLDNVERLVEGATAVVEALLKRCPGLTVLVTSRVPLELSMEVPHVVQPLKLPDLDRLPPRADLALVPAVALFLQRARVARRNFSLTRANAAAVAEICARLDGLPLAIELAAARIDVLSPREILTRLEPRLPLLVGGRRDQPAHHQTMTDAIAWSYDLVNPVQRALLCRMSVFAGGWTLPAAESVTSAMGGSPVGVLDDLTVLVRGSIVQRFDPADDAPGDSRFRLLETMREFGLDHLERRGESEAVRGAFLAYFRDLAERGEQELERTNQAAWLDQLEAEHDNLRTALDCAIAPSHAETALRLTSSLWRFWTIRGHRLEGRIALERALAIEATVDAAVRAKAHYRLGHLQVDRAAYGEARLHYQEALKIWRRLGDGPGVADALDALGLVEFQVEDYAAAQRLHEEAFAIRQRDGDDHDVALSLYNLADVAREAGQYAEADRLYARTLTILERIQDVVTIAYVLLAYGIAGRLSGEYPRTATSPAFQLRGGQ